MFANFDLWRKISDYPSDEMKISAIGDAVLNPVFDMDSQDVEIIANIIPVEFGAIKNNREVYSAFVERYKSIGCDSLRGTMRAECVIQAIEHVEKFGG